MKFPPGFTGAVVALTVLATVWGPAAHAEPAHDSAANLKELSEQAQQLTENLRSAQRDFDRKLQLLGEADRKYADDLAALDAANAELATYQGAVDRFAASVYMGGRTDGLDAVLTAASPTGLINKLAMQQLVVTDVSERMKGYRRATRQAQVVAAASAESAAAAKVAVDEAVAARAGLERKQSELRTEITAVQARYAVLEPSERAAMAVPASVVAALGLAPPIPMVGMGGLVPNARMLAAYVAATYPGVRSIGGVRSDPLPDHPSGRAIDIMISDMGLGDVILADIQSQAARFGVSYTLWRVASHFDHIHVTVN